MSTTSFDRAFVVADSDAIAHLKSDMQSPRKVKVKHRDHKKDAEKGIRLLKQRLSK
ncbi:MULTISPECIES: hypothetical protein [Shewanella]|uniref:hypothetical protein n=1 Tax=Shewanella TaxID=22 RepID=UPI00142E41F0|nr:MULTISPECIES: hypothetical protein [Shewanella]EKT4485666.1 hypothetical protein [Shewanella algae]MBC8798344.1 hypothetical protein [Shewanella algae]MBO2547363.1 hypothetical protein [Shewanella algae]QTE85128.1 hypothetical protein JKK44_13580 [Shewanella algae]GHA98863.1 hypothetical protein GCM10007107_09670 [Shewanella indica]